MRVRYLSLTLALLVVLAACNGDGSTTTTEGSDTTGSDTEATATTGGGEETVTTGDSGTNTTVAGTPTTGGEGTTPTTVEPFAMPGEDEVLVTMNGTDVATKDVLEILGEDGAATIDKSTFVNALSQLMQFRLIRGAATETHQVDEPGQDRIDGFLEENFPDQSVDEVATSAGFPSAAAVNEAIVVTLMLEDVEAKLADPSSVSDADAQTAIDDGTLTEVCASHILVATEEEANDAIARIEGGEDFAAVATEISTDTGSGANGGDLGCTNPSTYVPEFAEATLSAVIGELTAPVETQFGFHIIRVDERNEPNLQEAKQQLAEQEAATQSQSFLENTFNEAEVNVHLTSLGAWDPAVGGLVPASQVTPAPE
ncbi:MAG: hypothetical protein GEU79_01840 [Acidimicrobiia bacterium]|nr:hypothetical protein [Acidimicrobiia bacterium]